VVNLKESKELMLWTSTVIAVSVAVVFGHAFDNPGEVFLRELIRPTLFLSAASSLLVMMCMKVYPPVVKLIPAGLYILFVFSVINGWLPDMPL
jgi:hypothetical protein